MQNFGIAIRSLLMIQLFAIQIDLVEMQELLLGSFLEFVAFVA
jgi:hypothetical protein